VKKTFLAIALQTPAKVWRGESIMTAREVVAEHRSNNLDWFPTMNNHVGETCKIIHCDIVFLRVATGGGGN
jgi:hypothetical protein